ncbi:MAG: type II toxin-antitoxin system RelE/ParE family toxin [Candidatus Diapherotrites archaeon]|nr:type II toxin-antitoxin system RelE/ParE family toxin [Candidatus Diapherotrites archaeon]
MNLFEVRFSRKAEKFIETCETKIRERLETTFNDLGQTPVPAQKYDLRKIKGAEDIYRIRLSSYRIIYEILWKEKIIRVVAIEKRTDNTYDFL